VVHPSQKAMQAMHVTIGQLRNDLESRARLTFPSGRRRSPRGLISIGPEPSDRMEALLRIDGVADAGDADLAWKKLGKKHV
jgi:hypothetical protein